MKVRIHDIVTGIKYIYPCIAYEDSMDDNILIIAAETKLKSLFPIEMSVKGMTYLEEDFWGRPTFKDEKEQYYCELDGFLYFKGNSSDGEPHYPVKDVIQYNYPDETEYENKLNNCIEKVKEFIQKDSSLEFIESSFQLKESSESVLNNKYICFYKIKIKE